ncbi:ACP S-malonyltransferase [candidate division WOR-3 bacterium]|nr:ACP S-malonyltransferase [candidate division WOR-3 bacterium]
MVKLTAIFPGQGAQKVGMGKDLYDNNEKARELFERADEILEFSISDLSFNGPDDTLRISYNTQPAIFLNSAILYKLIEDKYDFSYTAGHSLGEYSALFASGVLSFEDGLRLVRERGRLMSEKSEHGEGTMAAIIGLPYKTVSDILEKANRKGIVIAANFNSPEQIVISGEKKAVKYACELAIDAKAKRAIELNVSNAFHSPLMKRASEQFADFIDQFEFKNPKIPFLAAGDLNIYTEGAEIKEYMKNQIMLPVKWVDVVMKMKREGVTAVVEIGPGRTLCNLIKRIDRDIELNTINSINQ